MDRQRQQQLVEQAAIKKGRLQNRLNGKRGDVMRRWVRKPGCPSLPVSHPSVRHAAPPTTTPWTILAPPALAPDIVKLIHNMPTPVAQLMVDYAWSVIRYRIVTEHGAERVEWIGTYTAGRWSGSIDCRLWCAPDVAAIAVQTHSMTMHQKRHKQWLDIQHQQQIPPVGEFGMHLFLAIDLRDVIHLLAPTPGYNYRRHWHISYKCIPVPFSDFGANQDSTNKHATALLNDIEMVMGSREIQSSVDQFDFPQHDQQEMERRFRPSQVSLVLVDGISPQVIWLFYHHDCTILDELRRVHSTIETLNPWHRPPSSFLHDSSDDD